VIRKAHLIELSNKTRQNERSTSLNGHESRPLRVLEITIYVHLVLNMHYAKFEKN
jgi:hypothetical protein